MLKVRVATKAFSTALMLLAAGITCGQDYPNKPVRIVATGAGGAGDFAARAMAQGISGSWASRLSSITARQT